MTSENTEITCGGCGITYETRIRGNTSRHACGHEQYVWKNPADAEKPAQEITCAGCGKTWESRAKTGVTIRCPHCKKTRKMPAISLTAPAEPRTAAPAPMPAPVRPLPVVARPTSEPVRPPKVNPPPAPVPVRPTPTVAPPTVRQPAPAPALPIGTGPGMALAIGALFGAVFPPKHTPSIFDKIATDGVESRPPRSGPVVVDQAATDRALASLMLTREPDWPAGSCSLGSCGMPVRHRVTWGPTARLDVCDQHRARIIAAARRLQRTEPTITALP